MTSDLLELSGWLFAAWGFGFACGYVLYMFRRFVESM